MHAVIALLAAVADTACPAPVGCLTNAIPAESLVAVHDEREPHLLPAMRERSKKERWLLEKARRPDVHVADEDLVPRRRGKEARRRRAASASADAESRLLQPMDPVGSRVLPLATFYNLWNREAWPVLAGRPYKRAFQIFLRDHFTHEFTWVDMRLAHILTASALHFRSNRVEIVSGYRSPKYNLMLRKKGHQVARESQHTLGTAVDFRVRNVGTEALHHFVRGLRVGGVGFYPRTRFIHADTGKVRYWSGS